MNNFYNQEHYEKIRLTEPLKKYLDAERLRLLSIKAEAVLDIGCGDGRSSRLLAQNSGKVVAIDNSLRQLKRAGDCDNPDNICYKLEDASKLSFENKSFDVVVMAWNTFGNLHKKRDVVLNEAIRVLSDVGVLYISVLSNRSLKAYIEFVEKNSLTVSSFDDGYVFLKEGHVSERFSKKKLSKMFEKKGLAYSVSKLSEVGFWCRVKARKC